MLAALDHLYLFLGLGRPKVRREDLPQESPRGAAAGSAETVPASRGAVHVRTRPRALALLRFYTALRRSPKQESIKKSGLGRSEYSAGDG